ncbi:MAG: hypothetical protein HQM16_03095 [Deltaproteobacteria bacterium]|nr:hypothetical protein [Deltaproteobacteria bacterium]
MKFIQRLKNQDRRLFFLLVVTFVNRLGYFIIPFLSLITVRNFGFSIQQSGLIMALGAMGLIAGNLASGLLIRKIGARDNIILAFAINISGFAALYFCSSNFVLVDYCPPFISPDDPIKVADNADAHEEPFTFMYPYGMPYNQIPKFSSFLSHPNGVNEVKLIRITIPGKGTFSQALNTVLSVSALEFVRGEEHLMEIFFSDSPNAKKIDLRPQYPLVIYI